MNRNYIERDLSYDMLSEPKHTCPKIDGVIQACREFDSALEERMEKIREANSAIREWGQAWKDKAVDLKMELEQMTGERDDLLNQVQNLRAELRSMEKVAAA
jgi:hypothetical protein